MVMKNYRTKNESFLRVSEQLRNNDVKNFDFMLELHDHTLLKVNPNDPNLDEYTKAKVLLECARNIWYYFRECLQIRNQDGEMINFELTKLTAAMIYLVEQNRHQYVLGHRVSYKTHTAYKLIEYCNTYLEKSLWHFEDAEYVDDIYDKFVKEYKDPIKNPGAPLLLLESVVNDDDSGKHSKIRDLATEWTDACYDIDKNDLDPFYYVHYNYKELVKNPMSFYRYYEIVFCHDFNVIRREILCERENR